MSSTSTAQAVTWGPYFGFTKNELLTELTRYKTARQQSFSRLIGSSIAGQTFQFGNRYDGTIDQWQEAIQAALYWLDPGLYPFPPPTNSAVLTTH